MESGNDDDPKFEDYAPSRRRYARVNFDGPVVIYDSRGFICSKGSKGLLSNGGLGLKGSRRSLSLGQDVTIEFLGSEELTPFWARGEVVSFYNSIIGLKFTALNPAAERALTGYTKEPIL